MRIIIINVYRYELNPYSIPYLSFNDMTCKELYNVHVFLWVWWFSFWPKAEEDSSITVDIVVVQPYNIETDGFTTFNIQHNISHFRQSVSKYKIILLDKPKYLLVIILVIMVDRRASSILLSLDIDDVQC